MPRTNILKLSRTVYRIAGSYSIVVLAPLAFSYRQIGESDPPAITHPEYFYGFLAVAISFAICFFIISADPLRLRPIMPAAAAEKYGYGIVCAWLFANHRCAPQVFLFGMVDVLFGVLFCFVFVITAGPTADPECE